MSPNYPDNYPPNMDCVWHITVDPRRQAVLTFSYFDIEDSVDCLDDYVDVSTLCAVNICSGNIGLKVTGEGQICTLLSQAAR